MSDSDEFDFEADLAAMQAESGGTTTASLSAIMNESELDFEADLEAVMSTTANTADAPSLSTILQESGDDDSSLDEFDLEAKALNVTGSTLQPTLVASTPLPATAPPVAYRNNVVAPGTQRPMSYHPASQQQQQQQQRPTSSYHPSHSTAANTNANTTSQPLQPAAAASAPAAHLARPSGAGVRQSASNRPMSYHPASQQQQQQQQQAQRPTSSYYPPTASSASSQQQQQQGTIPLQPSKAAPIPKPGKTAKQTKKSKSGDGTTTTQKKKKKKKKEPSKLTAAEERRNRHGKVIRSLLLSKMSTHLSSTSTQHEAGIPTVICVQGMMTIGTSRGFVLVYDAAQELVMMLGSASSGSNWGAVTAIENNHDNTRLLVGYESGTVVRWDLTQGKPLNTITNCYPKGSAVTSVAFTDDHTGALSNDAQGSVYNHSFKRIMGVRTVDNKCLWDGHGKHGQVCLMKVLHMDQFDHPHKAAPPQYPVVALGLLNKILIAFITPELKVALQVARAETDGAIIPSMAWNCVPVRADDGVGVIADPMLAFGWGKTVRFMQVITRKPKGSKEKYPTSFKTLSTYTSAIPVISIRWLSETVIMSMDAQERVHVIDCKRMTLVDIVDLTRVQLVCNDKFSVQQCKAKLRDPHLPSLKAYDQTIAGLKGNVYLLGMNSIHMITIMQWGDRIKFLVKQEKFPEALTLTTTFSNNQAMAVAGLPDDRVEAQHACHRQMLQILQRYAEVASSPGFAPRVNDVDGSVIAEICETILECCLRIREPEFLFGRVYTALSTDKAAREAFLDLLPPLIIDGKLKDVTSVVMKDLSNRLQDTGEVQTFEDCILQLEISQLDINQAVTVCKKHELLTGLLYVYNRGLHDYTTPLKDLIGVLRAAVKVQLQLQGSTMVGNAVNNLSDKHQQLGYKLLLYINFCLRGQAFPTGDIPAGMVEKVKWEVFKFVLQREGPEPFPCTRVLLHFDTRAFLNSLEVAFQDAAESNSSSAGVGAGAGGGRQNGLPTRQNVVDILLEIMIVEAERTGVRSFSAGQAGQLFGFLARQMARNKGSIVVQPAMFEKVLGFLTSSEDTTAHEERQQALLELLQVGTLRFDPNRLLHMATTAKFYRVCQFVYQQQGALHRVIQCYLLDSARQRKVFQFISAVLCDTQVDAREKTRVKEATIEVNTLLELTELDNGATARLLLQNFRNVVKPIVLSLEQNPKVQFKLLNGLVTMRDIMDEEEDVYLAPEVHELYVERMCQLKPKKVYPYLREASDYRTEECLELVQKYKIMDATAWLLEKIGDVRGAFDLIFGTFNERVRGLKVAYTLFDAEPDADVGVEDTRAHAYKGLRASLNFAIHMFSRASERCDASGREALWFPLLDTLLAAQRDQKMKLTRSLAEYTALLRDLTKHVVNSMMHYVALTTVLQKVILAEDAVHKSFGEIKDLLLGMLETYVYEKTLLQTTQKIIHKDMDKSIHARKRIQSKGIKVQSLRCCAEMTYAEATSEDSTLFVRENLVSCQKCRRRPKQVGRRAVGGRVRGGRRQPQDEEEEEATFSMRELEAQQKALDRRRQPSSDAHSLLSRFEIKKLLRWEYENESPRWQQLLDDLDAFRHNEGPPPRPREGMMASPDFELSVIVPRFEQEPINWTNWGGKPKPRRDLDMPAE